jgi:hypothetical protein
MEILTSNTFGRVWMVGGSVTKELLDHAKNPALKKTFDYWNLDSEGDFPYRDFDFIAEEIRGNLRAPRGWTVQINTFGGIKLKSKTVTVDLWKLRKHEPCRRHGLPYTIENVLKLTPLNVQSIAVDLREGVIVGNVGINAIETEKVAVNHLGEAEHYCKVYKTTIRELILKKASEYNFTPIFQ